MSKKKDDKTKTPDADNLEFMTVNEIKGLKRGPIVSATIPVDRLVPTENNPNEMSEQELSLLQETIRDNGFLDPISVIPLESGKFAINGGEHRWKVAKQLGMKDVPCEILYEDKWKDEELQNFQLVRFNVLHGKMNPEKFVTLYNKVVSIHGQEKVARLMGYTSNIGINKIIKQVSQQIKDTLPPDIAKKFDEEAKEAKTVGDLHKIIQHIFSEHGDTVQYSFIVFAFGGKEHIYISMNKVVHQAMKKILTAAKEKHLDINELLADALLGIANRLGGPDGDAN